MGLLGNGTPGFVVDPQIINMFKQMGSMNNPQTYLNQIVQTNPQFAQVLQMCNGKNPQDIFYKMCQQRGVNPDTILKQFR